MHVDHVSHLLIWLSTCCIVHVHHLGSFHLVYMYIHVCTVFECVLVFVMYLESFISFNCQFPSPTLCRKLSILQEQKYMLHFPNPHQWNRWWICPHTLTSFSKVKYNTLTVVAYQSSLTSKCCSALWWVTWHSMCVHVHVFECIGLFSAYYGIDFCLAINVSMLVTDVKTYIYWDDLILSLTSHCWQCSFLF